MTKPARRILIIDDDQTFLNLVSEVLNSAGFTPLQATNALDGLKQLDAQSPELVILDINMPQLDGMQTCRLIRSKEKFRSLPILMLTGRGDIKDMIEARKVGADDYLVKPFNSELLLQKLERLFAR